MSNSFRPAILSAIFMVLCACAIQPETAPAQAEFQHDFKGTAVPWTHTGFDNEDGKFTFALFSDLTGGEREGIFDIAVEQLRLLRPELIVNVGDLIEGGDVSHDQLMEQWDTFDERANGVRAPVFYVGGNHDLTGNELRQIWDERYGSKYYHFIYKNVLFLVLDTEDNPPEFQDYIYNIRLQALKVFEEGGWGAFAQTEYGQLEERKSGRISAKQADYFREMIVQHPEVRWTFLLMHKPVWIRPDEENFSRIEEALSDRPYTVFHGHLHSYQYEQRHGQDYIRLGTTGGGHTPGDSGAIDHVSMVTVSESGVDIANLRLSGIFDKTGKVPLNGDKTCFEGCSTND